MVRRVSSTTSLDHYEPMIEGQSQGYPSLERMTKRALLLARFDQREIS